MSTVVIIDDSVVVRKIVEASLRRVGVECVGYNDGYEALRAFRERQSDPPDLIFLDITMPRMDGFDVLRLLKTSPQFDQTPVVMLSARDGVLDRVKCRLAGARGYITKPFKTQELVSSVSQFLSPSTPPSRSVSSDDNEAYPPLRLASSM